MDFLEVYSSIVLVGVNFPPYVFKATHFVDLLGEPDPQKQIILPVISQQIFPSSGYKITITPDRLDVGYNGKDILPEHLKHITDSIVEELQHFETSRCTGLGINMDVVISDTVLGMTGVAYCHKHFLNMNNLEDKLGTSGFIANTTKLLYMVEDIRYTVDIEPNFRSKGKHLQIKINAHQNVERREELKKVLNNYQSIKEYFKGFHERFLGGE